MLKLLLLVRILVLHGVILVHLRMLVLLLHQSTIGVFVAVLLLLLVMMLLWVWIILSPLVVMVVTPFLLRRSHKDLDWDFLRGQILSVLLVLINSISDLGGYVLKVAWQWSTLRVSVLFHRTIPGNLRIVLLTYLLGLGCSWR